MQDETLSVPGVVVKPKDKCEKCGGPVFRKPCPCFMRNRGWAICAKCLNPKCSHTMGLKKKPMRPALIGSRGLKKKRR